MIADDNEKRVVHERLSERGLPAGNGCRSLSLGTVVLVREAPHARVDGAARRNGWHCLRVGLCEAQALGGEGVEVRCVGQVAPVGSDVVASEAIYV